MSVFIKNVNVAAPGCLSPLSIPLSISAQVMISGSWDLALESSSILSGESAWRFSPCAPVTTCTCICACVHSLSLSLSPTLKSINQSIIGGEKKEECGYSICSVMFLSSSVVQYSSCFKTGCSFSTKIESVKFRGFTWGHKCYATLIVKQMYLKIILNFM